MPYSGFEPLGHARPAEIAARRAATCRARPADGPRRVAPARPEIARASAAASRSGTRRPVTPSLDRLRQAAGRGRDDRRGRRQRLEREVRQAVDVAGVVVHGRHGDHVGRGERDARSRPATACREAGRPGRRRRSARARELVPRDRRRRRSPGGAPARRAARRPAASIRYSKPFLRTSRPAVKTRGASPSPSGAARRPRARRMWARSARCPRRTARSRCASASRAEGDRARAQIVAAGGDPAARAEHATGRAPRRCASPLGDEDVRSVQADDERQPAAGRAAITPPGTTQWPCMTVARFFAATRHALNAAGGERERRDDPRGAPQRRCPRASPTA